MARARLTESERQHVGSVFDEHRGFVEAVAIQHAGRDDAPEVVALVGLRLCQSLNGLRDRDAIRTWIFRVTVSAARDVQRDRRRFDDTRAHVAAVTTPTSAVLDPDDIVREGQRRDALRQALNRLKSREKTLICNSLDLDRVFVSGTADRVALSRARRRLRTFLQSDPRMRHE